MESKISKRFVLDDFEEEDEEDTRNKRGKYGSDEDSSDSNYTPSFFYSPTSNNNNNNNNNNNTPSSSRRSHSLFSPATQQAITNFRRVTEQELQKLTELDGLDLQTAINTLLEKIR